MNDDDPVQIADPEYTRRVRAKMSSRHLGALKQFHTICPCCGYVFEVDHHGADASILDKRFQELKRKVRNRIQEYFTNSWAWKTNDRPDGSGRGKHRSKGVSSPSVDMVVQAGAGKGLRRMYRISLERGWSPWFSVLWHDAPVIGEMFFACKLADLFPVLQAIADDSPEFAYRLQQAARNAMKRDGSAARSRRDGEVSREGSEDGVQGFDPGGAVSL